MPLTSIETSALTKTYGATRAVTDLDLQVEQGQVFGFLGPNGVFAPSRKGRAGRQRKSVASAGSGNNGLRSGEPSRVALPVLGLRLSP
jgi:hypothetical protein